MSNISDLEIFWRTVRTVRRYVTPHVSPDWLRLDAAPSGGALSRAELWLTPQAVVKFRENDFAFLPDQERAELPRLVADFRRLASEVPPSRRATASQIDAALPVICGIVEVLEFDRFADPEAFRVGKQVEAAIAPDRPAELVELRFETRTDSIGDPGIWTWALLDESATAAGLFESLTASIRQRLEDESSAVAPELWPYVGFRTVREQRRLDKAGRA